MLGSTFIKKSRQLENSTNSPNSINISSKYTAASQSASVLSIILVVFCICCVGIISLFSTSLAFATSISLTYDNSAPIPGPLNVSALIISAQAFNGTLKSTSSQEFINIANVFIDASSFVFNDATSVKTTVLLSVFALDTGSFSASVKLENASDSQIIASANVDSSFYYDTEPQVISAKLIPNLSNSSNLLVQFETDIPSYCKFDFVPTDYNSAVFSLYRSTQTNTVHIYVINDAKQKQYSFNVFCKSNSSQRVMSSPYVFTFNVTKDPPVVISHQPSIVNGGGGMQLSIQTNVASICKYSFLDAAYDSMTKFFDFVYGTSHDALIPITSDSIKIYVRCADRYNNIMTSSYLVNYIPQSTPSAVLDIGGYVSGSYLTDGLHTITLTVTPQLISPPSLTVSYIDGGIRSVMIPLIKSSSSNSSTTQTYTGSLQILPNEFSGIAYFDFSGIDLLGNRGTQITGETSVIVLARNPSPAQDLSANEVDTPTSDSDDNLIDVSWTYLADAYFDHFEIQKFYAADIWTPLSNKVTSSTNFRDRDVDPGKSYIYSITVVNKALKKSYPVFSVPVAVTEGSSNNTALKSQTGLGSNGASNSYVMPSYLSSNLLAIQFRLETLLADIKARESTALYGLIGAEKSNAQVISNLDAIIIASRKAVFNNNQQVSDYINMLLDQETKAKQNFVAAIRIIESQSEKQVITDDEYSDVFNEYLAAKRWDGDAEEFEFVLNSVKKNMERLTINGQTSLLAVTYINGAQALKTHVTKEIIGPLPSDSQLYEYIGMQTAQALWDNSEYERSIKFIITGSNSNLSYFFDGNVPKNQTAQYRTLFFPKNPFEQTQAPAGNFFATNFSLGSVAYYVMGFIAIIFLGLYYMAGSVSGMFDQPVIAKTHGALNQVWQGTLSLISKKNGYNAKDANLVRDSNNERANAILNVSELERKYIPQSHHSTHSDSSNSAHHKGESSQSHSLSDVKLDAKEILTSVVKAKDVTVVDSHSGPNLAKFKSSSSVHKLQSQELTHASHSVNSQQTSSSIFQKLPTAVRDYRAPSHLCFLTYDGKKIATLLELAFELSQMSAAVFAHHVNNSRHDFAIWIKDVFGLPKYAWALKEIKEREALAQAIFAMVEGGFTND